MPGDAQYQKRWRRRRRLYNAGLAAFFGAVAFYVGPNLILFGKPTWMTPADFVPFVEQHCVAIVRAMKEFRRDHGRLPDRGEELIPHYHPPDDPSRQFVRTSVRDGKFERWSVYNHTITYDFDPANEGWSVRGPYTSGPVPFPPVAIDPTSRPTSRPATSPATRSH